MLCAHSWFKNLCEDTVSSRSANSRQRSAIWQDTWYLVKKKMKKFVPVILLMTLLSGCDVINQLPGSTTTSSGTITQAEAAEGIKQALSHGLAKAVLQLNK